MSKDDNSNWRFKLNRTAKLWLNQAVHSKPLYIIPGVDGPNFCYICRESEIMYDVHINELDQVQSIQEIPKFTTVKESQTSPKFKSIQEPVTIPKTTTVQAHWGDHITVGLETKSKFYFRNHKTSYVFNTVTNKYDCHKLHCDVPFEPKLRIDEQTMCYNFDKPTPQTMKWYRLVANDPEVLPILQAILLHIQQPIKVKGGIAAVQGKSYYGPKGGKYILVHGRKIYVKKTMLGGAYIYKEDGFIESFIQFIIDYYIQPISVKTPKLRECILIDDEGSDQTMIRYIENTGLSEEVTVFAINKQHLQFAYHASRKSSSQRSVEEHTILNTLLQKRMEVRTIAVQN